MEAQISFLDPVPEEEAPDTRFIQPQDFHVGEKGWMLHAVVRRTKPWNPWSREPEPPIVCIYTYTDRWVSTREPRQQPDGRWDTTGERVRRKGQTYSMWSGGSRKLYRNTPTFDERIAYVHQMPEYQPGVRIIDADCIVALEGAPLSEAEKAELRGIVFN